MSSVYQPIVIEEVENMLLDLRDAQFFDDYEIEDLSFARQHLLCVMTQKFIEGKLEEDFEEVFTEEEFEQLLKELVAGSLLYELKDKGYVNSYEDENIEETFFLTEKGKNYIKDK